MKVFLTTAYDDMNPELWNARELAKLDRHNVHTVVDNPEESDLILFVEGQPPDDVPFYNQVKNHPLVQKYRTKSLIFTRYGRPLYAIPGLYVSLDKQTYDPVKQRATTYLEEVNEYIDRDAALNVEPDVLYSFMGTRSAPVRNKLFSFDHPSGILIDTTGYDTVSPGDNLQPEMVIKRKQDYVDLLQRSKFILCPRGFATSSFRLYETMKIQRVPVVLADDWVPPQGPNWEDFAVFIPERDMAQIGSILRELEPTWEERAKLARQAWEDYFASDVRFHYMIEQCKDILDVSNGDAEFFLPKLTLQEIYMRVRMSKLDYIISIAKLIVRRFLK